MTKRTPPPFIWAELAPRKFLVQRLVIGQHTGYRPYCTTDDRARAQHLVDLLTGDGPDREEP